MNFLIDLFKKAPKGDAFRRPENLDKYADKIAQLNSTGANQYNKITTNSINRIQKTKTEPTQNSSKGSVLPSK